MQEEERKTDKKKKRFAARLKSSKGIICTDKSNRNIILCNVGQATGLTKENVHTLIRSTLPNIVLPKLLAEKGETHSFLVFNNEEEAESFYKECNGKSKLCETLIYMSFVESVPNLEVIIKDDLPKGLVILNDFITPEEETLFLKLFDFEESSNLKNRQVKHYGYEFRYGSNDVDLAAPLEEGIPPECQVLWKRLNMYGVKIEEPDQLTINKYHPGQGIPSHVDKHSPFEETILSLSLGSAVVMDWRHHSGKYVPVVLPVRSLLVMQGEARYDWQHGIQPRTWDPVITELTPGTRLITTDTTARGPRLSLTFRKTRSPATCRCEYSALCDRGRLDDDAARRLEDLHVHQVYEQIAGHFSTTRHKPWPRVVQFLARVPAGSVVLDLGCGNGKNVLPRTDIFQLACERSSGLLSECHSRLRSVRHVRHVRHGADCVRLDLAAAPLRDGVADGVACIAVVHHFSSPERRLAAIKTIARLLRAGGFVLITVWSRDQTHASYLSRSRAPGAGPARWGRGRAPGAGPARRVDVGPCTLPVHENRTQFQHQDLLVPWKLRSKNGDKLSNSSESTLLRYYHVFEEGELSALCEAAGLVVTTSFYEEGNWCVICTKN